MDIPLRILLVEDLEDDALLVARALRRGGYAPIYERVDTLPDLEAALARSGWEIVISDYAMPQLDGMTVLGVVRTTAPELPVILVSGTIGEEVAVAAMKAGAADYVMKGNLTRLAPAIERELQEATSRRARRQAEEELHKLSRAVEQSPVSVIITNVQGQVEYVNPRFTQITGYTLEDLEGQTPSVWKSGETQPETYAELWELITSGGKWDGEFHNRKKNGDLYWVSASITPIYNQDGIINHFLAIEEDITERKQAEAARMRQLENIQRQQATLVYLATHPALTEGRLEEALPLIAEAAATTLQVARTAIWHVAPMRAQMTLSAVYTADPALAITAPVMQREQYPDSMALLFAGHLLVADDVANDPRLSAMYTAYWRQHGVTAALQVPVRLQGEVIGVIGHIHCHSARKWTSDEVSFASQVADLVSQTYLNADLRRRAEELAAITRVSREITLVPNLQRVFESIAWNAAELSQSDAGGVFAFRPDGALYIAAAHGVSTPFLEAVTAAGIPREQDAIGRAALEAAPIQIYDLADEPDTPFKIWSVAEGIRSMLAVPMVREEAVIGGIVLWRRQPRHFTAQSVAFIQALAQQCVNAVENARLFEAEAQRRREAETLRAVTQALSATLDQERVLALILSELQRVIPYDSASVQQLRGDYLEIIDGRGFADMALLVGARFDLIAGDNPNKEVIRSRAPLILADGPAHYADFHRQPHDAMEKHSWLGVPLIFSDRLIGMITLDKIEPGFYNQDHARLALAFAAQAAIAIENARLFAEEEQRATELARALEQQRKLDQLKDQFIQNVSHELRTPLAIARGYAELLNEGDLGPVLPAQQGPVAIMARRLQMLSALVDDINAILDVESQPLRRELLDIANLVRGVLVDFESSVNKMGLSLGQDLAPDLPMIPVDLKHFHRLLDNLLGNALKFTPAGGKINVQLYREADYLTLAVTDTGIGIPEDQLERIFDRFYQVDGSMSRRHGGTGLGLALVKGIAHAHGGRVEVESTLGAGSTFRVKFPING